MVLYDASLVYAILGDRRNASDHVEEALVAGYSKAEILGTPELAGICASPRFTKWASVDLRKP
jgi:hypothetical protein